jgi:glycerophosphoryl diester phosphodiesterase
MGHDVGILLDPSLHPVIAHRGASGSYPENTLLALDQALRDGADALEFDVRVSADGVPVVIHDPTVDRTTDGVGRVRALTVAELERLDAGRGERVPRLDAVLERFVEAVMLIDIKDAAASPAVLEILMRHGAERRVLVGSFQWRALLPFARAGIPTTAARVGVAAALLASRVGRAWPAHVAAYAVPERRGRVQVVDERFVSAARTAGRPVHVWTVNRLGDARRLRNLGVSGIITDVPGEMRNLCSLPEGKKC